MQENILTKPMLKFGFKCFFTLYEKGLSVLMETYLEISGHSPEWLEEYLMGLKKEKNIMKILLHSIHVQHCYDLTCVAVWRRYVMCGCSDVRM